jgi:hypothetical protein
MKPAKGLQWSLGILTMPLSERASFISSVVITIQKFIRLSLRQPRLLKAPGIHKHFTLGCIKEDPELLLWNQGK